MNYKNYFQTCKLQNYYKLLNYQNYSVNCTNYYKLVHYKNYYKLAQYKNYNKYVHSKNYYKLVKYFFSFIILAILSLLVLIFKNMPGPASLVVKRSLRNSFASGNRGSIPHRGFFFSVANLFVRRIDGNLQLSDGFFQSRKLLPTRKKTTR